MLCSFSGADSSGKSTAIAGVLNRAKGMGIQATSIWYRPGYSSSLTTLRKIVRRVRPGILPPPGQSTQRNATFARPGVSEAWLLTATLDALTQYGLRVRYLASVYDLLVCDRYLDDAFLDLELSFPNHLAWVRSARKALLFTSPKPDLAFLLHLNEQELDRRAAVKNEPFPDPEHTRSKRRERYVKLAASGRFVTIDAGRSPEEVHDSLWKHLIAHPKAPHQVRKVENF
jgi:thymidylate kinase